MVDVVKQLIATGKATRISGSRSTAMTPEIQQQLGLSTTKGVSLQQVAANGPAARGGLQTGDVIVDIDGQPITSPEDLLAALRRHQPGDQITVTYLRNGEKKTANVTLADRPSQ